MRKVVVAFVVVLLASCSTQAADVGVIDQKPPTSKELAAPKSDAGIEVVRLRATVTGKVLKGEKRRLYVAVNPLSNPANFDQWWIQQPVNRDGETFSAEAQFGEGTAGVNEFFAIVGIATDKDLSVGDVLDGLPEDATFSKLKLVKRK